MANNLTLAQRMRVYFEDALGSQPLQRAPEHFGSIDMGNVTHVLPAVRVLFDIANGKPMSPHTREFCDAAITPYASASLIQAGKALALTGYDALSDAGFLAAVKKEFIEQRS